MATHSSTTSRFAITETEQTDAHRRSSNTSRAKWRAANPASTRYHGVPTRFIGVDGEGVTLADGSHHYVLLGVGDQQLTSPKGFGLPLTWQECFEFLYDRMLEEGTKGVAYVGFFLGYDFIQILKGLPEADARSLLTRDGQKARQKAYLNKKTGEMHVTWEPVRVDGWDIDILGMKRLKIRPTGEKRWMNICDTGPFFQKSFISVINPEEWFDVKCPQCQQSDYPCAEHQVCSEADHARILAGKQRRSSAILDRDMLAYNQLENATLSRVLERLNTGFQSLGVHLSPSQWYGPGAAAQFWLTDPVGNPPVKNEVVPCRVVTARELSRPEIIPRVVLEHARESYTGGWFEITAHGIIPGITYEYDVRSAYPYVISQLPCLEHGEWKHNDDTGAVTLVSAAVRGSHPVLGAMLHRDRWGNIYRPHRTEGWYWKHELDAAVSASLVDSIEELETWSYHACPCPPPLREVADFYEMRIKAGKKTPLGVACKLVPNSLYGKFAQSVGSPKFGNPVYASLITAGCRTLILGAIATHPVGAADVLMIATDGIYFQSPHPGLDCEDKLGNWEPGEKHNITLFKPGVYWDDKAREAVKAGETPVFKARGMNARAFGKRLGEVDKKFKEESGPFKPAHGLDISWAKIEYPVEFTITTCLQAIMRNDWTQAGNVLSDVKAKQHASPHNKRSNPRVEGASYGSGGKHNRGIIRSSPRINEPYEPSHPYEKRFGIDDPFGQETLETWGISQDGYPAHGIQEGLGLK